MNSDRPFSLDEITRSIQAQEWEEDEYKNSQETTINEGDETTATVQQQTESAICFRQVINPDLSCMQLNNTCEKTTSKQYK